MGWRDVLAGYVNAIGGYLFGRDMDTVARPESVRLADAVEDARQQWLAARAFFNDVTDPRLIDYAVYSIGAAERRYMFLLEEARRQGVEVHPLGLPATAGTGDTKGALGLARPSKTV